MIYRAIVSIVSMTMLLSLNRIPRGLSGNFASKIFVRRSYSKVALTLLYCRKSLAFSQASISILSHSSALNTQHPPVAVRNVRYFSSSTDDESASDTTHLPRLFVHSSALSEESLIPLTEFQSNYLSVMRLSNSKRWGQWAGHARVFNGKNGEWLAKMVISDNSAGSFKRKRRQSSGNTDIAILECVQQIKEQPAISEKNNVHLHMGRIKKQRRKWVLEKATELGITEINVVDTEFSSTTEDWEYEKHYMQVIEAAEQCERMTVPLLNEVPTAWSDFVQNIRQSNTDTNAHYWLVCRERSPELTEPILKVLSEIEGNSSTVDLKNIHLLVGPEGGWSPSEIDDLTNLQKDRSNVHFVSLGSLVLRAETAAISAVAASMLINDQ